MNGRRNIFTVSSANFRMLLLISSSKSFINIKNNRGPKTDPFNLEKDLSAVATVTWQREKQKKNNFSKKCYLVLAGGPPRVVGPGAPHHLHHLYGRTRPPNLRALCT